MRFYLSQQDQGFQKFCTYIQGSQVMNARIGLPMQEGILLSFSSQPINAVPLHPRILHRIDRIVSQGIDLVSVDAGHFRARSAVQQN